MSLQAPFAGPMSASDSQFLSGEWAYVAAGVAWVSLAVVTTPADLPVKQREFQLKQSNSLPIPLKEKNQLLPCSMACLMTESISASSP